MNRIRTYRRIGAIDDIEVHKPPVGPEVFETVPDIGHIIDKGALKAYRDFLRRERELGVSIGVAEQHIFVARDKDGNVEGILAGFFLGDLAYDRSQLDELQQELFARAAYIDALESYEKRRGVGRRLVAAFEVWAREQGAEYIAGSPTDAKARAFNVSVGLEEGVPYGDVRYWGKKI